MERALRHRLAARPECPAPMTTVVTCSMVSLRYATAGAMDDVSPHASQISGRRCPYATSTVTFVGLVMTSYTAERFCDCATSASISSFDASASILNVTLMSS